MVRLVANYRATRPPIERQPPAVSRNEDEMKPVQIELTSEQKDEIKPLREIVKEREGSDACVVLAEIYPVTSDYPTLTAEVPSPIRCVELLAIQNPKELLRAYRRGKIKKETVLAARERLRAISA